MATIVKHFDKKTGKTRVYESTPHYDPVTKQSRPKRKYLGTLDPETGELIPSSGRRGRVASAQNDADSRSDGSSEKIAKLQKAISEKDFRIAALTSEVESLQHAIRSYSELIDSISKTLAKARDIL